LNSPDATKTSGALCLFCDRGQTFNELAPTPWEANDELHAAVEAARERIITRALSAVCRRLGKLGARLAERKHTRRRRLIKECASKYGPTDTNLHAPGLTRNEFLR